MYSYVFYSARKAILKIYDDHHCNAHIADFETGKRGLNAIGCCFLLGILFTTLFIALTSTVSPISAIIIGL